MSIRYNRKGNKDKKIKASYLLKKAGFPMPFSRKKRIFSDVSMKRVTASLVVACILLGTAGVEFFSLLPFDKIGNLFVEHASAAAPAPDPSQDGSNGNLDAEDFYWYTNSQSARYNGKTGELGSVTNPYLIKNADELTAFSLLCNHDAAIVNYISLDDYNNLSSPCNTGFQEKYITLCQNGNTNGYTQTGIDLNSYGGNFGTDGGFSMVQSSGSTNNYGWTPIGTDSYPFKGYFDGGSTSGYVIENLAINNHTNMGRFNYNIGFFGYVDFSSGTGYIKNVNLLKAQVKTTIGNAGVLVGTMKGKNTDTGTGSDIPAFIPDIENCSVSGRPDDLTGLIDIFLLKAPLYTGGIVGGADKAYVKGCSVSNGDISLSDVTTANQAAGGIAGSVIGSSRVFFINNTITNCSVVNTASLECFLGGIIGFSNFYGGVLQNNNTVDLIVDNQGVNTRGNTGGIIGCIQNNVALKATFILNSSLTKSSGTSTVLSYGDRIGGVVGSINTARNHIVAIRDCSVQMDRVGTLNNYTYVGGVTGYQYNASVQINGCTVSSEITGSKAVGGIAGNIVDYTNPENYLKGAVTACTFSGKITDAIANTGGSTAGIGGIIGQVTSGSPIIEYCVFTGQIEYRSFATNTFAGGIVGLYPSNTSQSIKYCISAGSIKTTETPGSSSSVYGFGGLVGRNLSTYLIERSISVTDISIVNPTYNASNSIGGIIGATQSSTTHVKECISGGKITGNGYIGGIIARDNGTGSSTNPSILSSYFSGVIYSLGYENTVGGIVSTTNSYSWITARNSYSSGLIISPWAASVAGSSSTGTKYDNVYYDKTISPNKFLFTGTLSGTSIYGGMTTAQMTTIANYIGSDFTYGSAGAPSYPQLSWAKDASFASSWTNTFLGYEPTASFKTGFADAVKNYSYLTTRGWSNLTNGTHNLAVSNNTTLSVSTNYQLADGVSRSLTWTLKNENGSETAADQMLSGSSGSYSVNSQTPEIYRTDMTATVSFNVLNTTMVYNIARRFVKLPTVTGSGIEADSSPYTPDSASDLVELAKNVSAGGGFLGSKILLSSSYTYDYSLLPQGTVVVPLGMLYYEPFCGIFDGAGVSIKYFNLSDYTKEYSAFSGRVVYGTFKNLKFINTNVTFGISTLGNTGMAVGIGYLYKGEVSGVTVDADIVRNGPFTNGSITCYNGGIIGISDSGTVKQNYFTGNVTGSNVGYFGGIVGEAKNSGNTITNCFSAASITGTSDRIGGIVSSISATVVDGCSFYGKISGVGSLGGIASYASSAGTIIKNSYSNAYLSGTNDAIGGILGNATLVSVQIQNSYFAGQLNVQSFYNVNSRSNMYGAIAGNFAVITNCYYDKQLLGEFPLEGSEPIDVLETGDNSRGLKTSELMNLASTLGSSFTNLNTTTYYPQITYFNTNALDYSKISTLAVLRFSEQSGNLSQAYDAYQFTGYTGGSYSVTITEPAAATPFVNKSSSVWVFDFTSGGYSALGNTVRALNIRVTLPNSRQINKSVDFQLTPFATGSGMKDDPFGIPDVTTLLDFRDFINGNFGRAGAYYKLTKSDGDVYDMSTEESRWLAGGGTNNRIPIGANGDFFTGNFLGNNKTISNLKLAGGTNRYNTNTNGNVGVGLFSRVISGSVTNLTISNAVFNVTTTNNANADIGLVAGYARNAIIANIKTLGCTVDYLNTSTSLGYLYIGSVSGQVLDCTTIDNVYTDTNIITNMNATTTDRLRVGGIAGQVSSSISINDLNSALYISNAVSFATIEDTTLTPTKVLGYFGGIAGYIDSSYAVYITNTAFYGSLKNSKYMGGIVGRTNNSGLRYSYCVSLGTIKSEVSNTYMGGFFGYLSGNVFTSFANSYSGAQISSSPGVTVFSGGILGYSNLSVSNSNTTMNRTTNVYFDNRVSGTDLAVGTRQYTDAFFDWMDASGTKYDAVRMTTLELSSADYTTPNGSAYFSDTSHFSYVNGLYPLILFSAGDISNTYFANDTALRDKIKAASIAVYFVAANDVNSNTSTGAYVLYSDAYLADLSSGTYMKLASNGKRIAATGDGTSAIQSFNAKSTALPGYLKSYAILPDIRSTGVTDISFLEICPNGDGFVSGAKFGLYTADQLAGFSQLVNSYNTSGEIRDGNGLKYTGNTAILNFSGITTALGCDIDMTRYNPSINANYPKWNPIGKTSATPFMGIFSGGNKTITNFYLINSGSAGDPGVDNGLFGYVAGTAANPAGIRNLGLTNGRIQYTAENGAANVGSLAGTLSSYTSVTNCFSSLLIEIKSSGVRTPINAGGLAGNIQGISAMQDTVTNCYFTGVVLSTNPVDYCGGFFGSAGYTSVSGSYVAAFSDNSGSDGFGIIAGRSNGGLSMTNTYCDGPVCGYIEIVGTGAYEGTANAIESDSLVAASNNNCPSGLVSGFPLVSTEYTNWKYVSGCYPLLNGFSGSATISAIPIYINPHSKATTSGNVNYSNTILTFVADEFSYVGSGSYIINNSISFVKSGTGKTVIRIDYTSGGTTYSRYSAMDMKCWFDNEENGVFTIYNANELAELASIVNGTFDIIKPTGQHEHEVLTNGTFDKSFIGKTIILGQNIDLSAFSNWTPIGDASNPFKGTFNGQGFMISGLTINTSAAIAGLFGVVLDANIHDITLKSGSIIFNALSSNTIIGPIAAITEGTTVIEHCSNSVGITVNSADKSLTYTAGGLVGSVQGGTISECYNMAQMKAGMTDISTTYFGGIAGEIGTGANVVNCYNTGIIAGAGLVGTQVNYMGGIAGKNDGTVSKCYNAGVVHNSATLSPIACQGNGTISDCFYDLQLFSTEYSHENVQGFYTYQINNGSKPSELSSWSDSIWYFNEPDSYPQLTYHIGGSTEQKASSAISAISFDFKTGNYISFNSGVMKSTVTLGGMQYTIVPKIVDESQGSCVFDKVGTDPYSVSTGRNKGAVYIDATITVGSVHFIKRLYCNVERNLVVRYKFDFSNLLSDPLYHELNTTRNYTPVSSGGSSAFMQNGHGSGTIGDPYQISSPEDMAAFSDYVNAGGKTTDTFFILKRPINMTGVALTPIGTATHKFLGIFDGNGYEISGLNIERQGSAALFSNIGISGKVKNLGIRTARITVLSQSGDMLGGIIAVNNEGTISSCFATGDVELKESGGGGTIVGGLVAKNLGRIQGCYFIADGRQSEAAKTTGIIHWGVESPDVMVGGLVGQNTGKIDGCYAATDIAIRTGYCGNAIVGYNSTTDGITNSFFDSYLQNSYYIPYAYTDSENGNISRNLLAKTTAEMKTSDTAKALSWDLYGGTFECTYDPNDGLAGDDPAITTINSGYPYLGVFEMNKYSLTDFSENTSMILSIKNQSAGDKADDVMNAICTYLGYGFPKFGAVTVQDAINVSLLDIPQTIDYNVSIKAYGETEGGEPLYVDNLTGLGNKLTGRVINTELFPSNTYRIEITISLIHINDTYIPWGVYRKWNSILQ